MVTAVWFADTSCLVNAGVVLTLVTCFELRVYVHTGVLATCSKGVVEGYYYCVGGE